MFRATCLLLQQTENSKQKRRRHCCCSFLWEPANISPCVLATPMTLTPTMMRRKSKKIWCVTQLWWRWWQWKRSTYVCVFLSLWWHWPNIDISLWDKKWNKFNRMDEFWWISRFQSKIMAAMPGIDKVKPSLGVGPKLPTTGQHVQDQLHHYCHYCHAIGQDQFLKKILIYKVLSLELDPTMASLPLAWKLNNFQFFFEFWDKWIFLLPTPTLECYTTKAFAVFPASNCFPLFLQTTAPV